MYPPYYDEDFLPICRKQFFFKRLTTPPLSNGQIKLWWQKYLLGVVYVRLCGSIGVTFAADASGGAAAAAVALALP